MKAASPPILLVVSDTHSSYSSLTAILRWAKHRNIDAFAFLGDGVSDLNHASELTGFYPNWTIVRGNCDWQNTTPLSATLSFAGRTFFLSHGHINGVKESLASLVIQAKAHNADAALFGHTHIAFWDEIDGVLVLNPGSAGCPRGHAPASFATIACPANEWFNIQYWSIEEGAVRGKVIKEMSL
jgi:putative phosphoesterase